MTGMASDLYGSWSGSTPTPANPGGSPAAGTLSPAGQGVRTTPAPAESGLFGQPLFWLMALIGLAVGLVGFSLRVGK